MGERRGPKALEEWCRRITDGYSGVNITNMTTAWRDGLAFCAMVHSFRPDLIDFDKLKKDDVYYNNELAFRTAEIHLGIPALLDADDMVSSEVPDRLSILTYLSQYYQTFAAQDGSTKVKSSTDKCSVPKLKTIPTSKMAHKVGVPKREPCQKCGLPVFLAERLSIGKVLFHRTCLKCARCNSQLTLGNFYETEIDGEFCCETCPDEEKEIILKDRLTEDSLIGNEKSTEYKSFQEKLAIFQNEGKGLLQKSLSDEEKSKSLKKLCTLSSGQTEFMASQLSGHPTLPIISLKKQSSNDDQDNDNKSIESSRSSSNSSLSNEIDNSESLQSKIIESVSSSLTIHNIPEHRNASALDTEINNLEKQAPPTPSIALFETRLSSHNSINSPVDAFNDVSNVTKVIKQSTSEKLSIAENVCSISKVERSPLSELKSNDNALELKSEEKKLFSDNVVGNSDNLSSKLSEVPVTDQLCSNYNVENGSDIFEQKIENEIADNDYQTSASNDGQNHIKHDDAECNDENSSNIETSLKLDANTEYLSEIKPEKNEYFKLNTEVTLVTENNLSTNSVENVEIISNSSKNEEKNDEKPAVLERSTLNKNDETPIPVARKRTSEQKSTLQRQNVETNRKPSGSTIDYPSDLNPFGSDEDDFNNSIDKGTVTDKSNKENDLNPFDSSDDEIELLKDGNSDKAETLQLRRNNESWEYLRKQPVPTPRHTIASSLHTTPEPKLRKSHITYGLHDSEASLTSFDATTKNNRIYGSVNSLSSGYGDNIARRKKGRAPLPPTDSSNKTPKIIASSAGNSPQPSPKLTPTRKKRMAPRPPSSTPKKENRPNETSLAYLTAFNQSTENNQDPLDDSLVSIPDISILAPGNEDDTLESACKSDEFKTIQWDEDTFSKRKLIPLEASLVTNSNSPLATDSSDPKTTDVVYRRTIVPFSATESSVSEDVPKTESTQNIETHGRQWQKVKENKESQNKNRQSQISVSSNTTESDTLYLNKSSHGKWKRRKGPAPGLPIPQRKVLQMLPLHEIRHELEVIEVQQQGLEKQGVMLEKMIRDRCESHESPNVSPSLPAPLNSKEVEDLILQLFELVNEKNELFRRQAELMYLRRQHRLEQEQADIEYEIRVLMAQPEQNKTDSDKAKEENLIARLVELVQLRNEVVDCLEMDRLREAEEDQSIKNRLEQHNAQRKQDLTLSPNTKLSKKEKKKQKEVKKLLKQRKMDADKDADESEVQPEKIKEKKKKLKFLFS